MDISCSENCSEILIFGGKDKDDKRMDRCMVFSGSFPALEDGTLTALKNEERLRKAIGFD